MLSRVNHLQTCPQNVKGSSAISPPGKMIYWPVIKKPSGKQTSCREMAFWIDTRVTLKALCSLSLGPKHWCLHSFTLTSYMCKDVLLALINKLSGKSMHFALRSLRVYSTFKRLTSFSKSFWNWNEGDDAMIQKNVEVHEWIVPGNWQKADCDMHVSVVWWISGRCPESFQPSLIDTQY